MSILFHEGAEVRADDGSLIATVSRDIVAGDDPFAANNFNLVTGDAVVGEFMPESIRKFILEGMGVTYKKPVWRPSILLSKILWERAHGVSFYAIAKKYGTTAETKSKWGWVKRAVDIYCAKMRSLGVSLTFGSGGPL